MDVLVRAHRHTTDDEIDFVRVMMELISDIQDVNTAAGPQKEIEDLDELIDLALDLECELEELRQELVEAQEEDDEDAAAELEAKIAKVKTDLDAQPAAVCLSTGVGMWHISMDANLKNKYMCTRKHRYLNVWSVAGVGSKAHRALPGHRRLPAGQPQAEQGPRVERGATFRLPVRHPYRALHTAVVLARDGGRAQVLHDLLEYGRG